MSFKLKVHFQILTSVPPLLRRGHRRTRADAGIEARRGAGPRGAGAGCVCGDDGGRDVHGDAPGGMGPASDATRKRGRIYSHRNY